VLDERHRHVPIGIDIDHRDASASAPNAGGSASGMSCYRYNILSSLAAQVPKTSSFGAFPTILHRRCFGNSTQLAWRSFGVRPPAVSLLTRHEIHSIIEPKQSEAFS
jgi:hypothetical protein